jgi:spectinomycin phosphotransferase
MEIDIKKLMETIKREYGIQTSYIEQLNIGFDKNTILYRLFSFDKKVYFLKIRLGKFLESSIKIHFLLSKNIGLGNIINPIETLDKKLYVKLLPYAITIYPYINGQSGWDVKLTKDQFINFGKFMFNLHSITLPKKHLKSIPDKINNKKYIIKVKKYLQDILNLTYKDTVILEFIKELEIRKNIILEIIDYLEKTMNDILLNSQNNCICHGDIHAGNLLIDKNNFFVVDWDTIILAPKEKDLMFIGAGIGDKWNKQEEIEYFYKGYGKNTEISKTLIRYFRYERIIQDIFEFYQEIMIQESNDEKRKLSLKLFKSQFEPKNVVEMAYIGS